ncbi:MAG: hypothetical protein KDI51_17170, partial [Xanthomonadales bacterium]|nr:hypothetical protein [Xanthomonadales bacterium]
QTGTAVIHDLNMDGLDDLFSFGTRLRVYDMTNGAELRNTLSVSRPNFSVLTNVGFDPGLDIVTNGNVTSADTMEVWSVDSGLQQFELQSVYGPMSALARADIDGSGTSRILLVTPAGQFTDLNLYVLDEMSGIRQQQSLAFANPFGANAHPTLQTYDADGVGGQDIAITTQLFEGPTVIVLRGSDLQPIWQQVLTDLDTNLAASTLLDQNGDGTQDLIVATANRLVILDGRDGTEIVRSDSFAFGPTTAVTAGQLQAGSDPTILFALGADIRRIDPTTGVQLGSFAATDVVIDLQVVRSQQSCYVIATLPQRLERYDCATGLAIDARELPDGTLYANLPDGWDGDLVLSDGERLQRFRNSDLVAESELLDSRLGDFNRGLVIPGLDGSLTVFSGGARGVFRLDLPAEEPLFADGFEF